MDSKNRTCTVEGCSKPLKSRGYCTGHYKSIIDRPKIKQKKIEETKAARQEVINRKISENASKFTPEQLERILLTPCRTEKDLKNFIRYFFNLHLPDCKEIGRAHV